MNEDKRYWYYPYIRPETVVEFVGGPLNGKLMDIGYNEELSIHVMDELPKFSDYADEFPNTINIKIGKYRKFLLTWWVTGIGLVPVYGAYYLGH